MKTTYSKKNFWVITSEGVEYMELRNIACSDPTKKLLWSNIVNEMFQEGVNAFDDQRDALNQAMLKAADEVKAAIMKHDKIRMEIAAL